jgi:hypothetical protein
MFGIYTASVEKLHGTWRVVPNPVFPLGEMRAFDCSQIPPEQFDPNSALVQHEFREAACRRFMSAGSSGIAGWDQVASLRFWMTTIRDRSGQDVPGPGVDPKTCRDDKGNTVLMILAGSLAPPVEAVQALLGMGLDLNARNNAGETALVLARKAAANLTANGLNPGEPNRVISLLMNIMDPQPVHKTLKKKSAAPGAVQGSGPESTLWTGIKNGLTAENGYQYFGSALKDAAIPTLKGTVVGSRPACNPKELLVAISDASNAEVSVRLQTPLNGMLQPGVQIEWEGVPSAFTRSPFLLTMETVNSKIRALGMLQVSPCTP